MKIKDMQMYKMRNDEHFQFHMEIKELVILHLAEKMDVQEQFEEYKRRLAEEDGALKKIVKSEYTQQLVEADAARDDAFHGLSETCATALRRADPAARAAAARVKIALDTYGNIAKKPYNEQTSATYNLLQDLNSAKYLADAAAIGLSVWMQELQAGNEAFTALMRERFGETAMRNDTAMKSARAALDETYGAILERVRAHIVFNGLAACEPFIRNANAVIDKYALIIKMRAGRGSAKAAKKDEPES